MDAHLIGFFLDFAGPIAMLGLVLWLHSLKKIIPLPDWRSEWPNVLVALLASASIYLTVAVDFKVLSDETNLLAVSNMLTLFGKASNTEMVTTYYHLPHALQFAIPTRPVLFPMMSSLVQHVAGLHYWAPFVVNFALTFLLFWLSLVWARKTLSAKMHPLWVTTLALLMSPVLAIVATSAGYDLCSLVFAFALFLLLQRYNQTRDSDTLVAIFYGLVCFASVRYESIVALPLTVAALVLFEGFGWIKKIPPLAMTALVVLVAPLLVQRLLTWGNFENPPGVAPFSFGHIVEHFPVFVHSFFFDVKGPYPIVLHWLGVIGLCLALRRAREFDWVALAYSIFLLGLLLAHHFGFANHPTQARLFLALSFALGLCALYGLSQLERWSEPKAVLLIFALLFVHHHQYAVSDPLTTQLTMTREVRHIRAYLAKDDHRDDLFVYDRPGQLTALGFSAISWAYFEEHRDETLQALKAHLYQRIITIDRPKYAHPDATPLVRLGYKLVPLIEHQLSPDEELRLAKVEF